MAGLLVSSLVLLSLWGLVEGHVNPRRKSSFMFIRKAGWEERQLWCSISEGVVLWKGQRQEMVRDDVELPRRAD
jgi:hypothetical protein